MKRLSLLALFAVLVGFAATAQADDSILLQRTLYTRNNGAVASPQVTLAELTPTTNASVDLVRYGRYYGYGYRPYGAYYRPYYGGYGYRPYYSYGYRPYYSYRPYPMYYGGYAYPRYYGGFYW